MEARPPVPIGGVPRKDAADRSDMARYIFFHIGARPVVTPDLPSTDAVESWARGRYLYDEGAAWTDIPEADWEAAPGLPGTWGDVTLDWPVRRTLLKEDWYAGPIEVIPNGRVVWVSASHPDYGPVLPHIQAARKAVPDDAPSSVEDGLWRLQRALQAPLGEGNRTLREVDPIAWALLFGNGTERLA